MKATGWIMILIAVLSLAAGGSYGYSIVARHRAFHAQAQAAVDALQRLEERTGDGAISYAPAYEEAEQQVQTLSHLQSNVKELSFSIDADAELQQIQLARNMTANVSELLDQEKELVEAGGKADMRAVNQEMKDRRDAADQAEACMKGLFMQLDLDKREPSCVQMQGTR